MKKPANKKMTAYMSFKAQINYNQLLLIQIKYFITTIQISQTPKLKKKNTTNTHNNKI